MKNWETERAVDKTRDYWNKELTHIATSSILNALWELIAT